MCDCCQSVSSVSTLLVVCMLVGCILFWAKCDARVCSESLRSHSEKGYFFHVVSRCVRFFCRRVPIAVAWACRPSCAAHARLMTGMCVMNPLNAVGLFIRVCILWIVSGLVVSMRPCVLVLVRACTSVCVWSCVCVQVSLFFCLYVGLFGCVSVCVLTCSRHVYQKVASASREGLYSSTATS